jgi:anthranilate phosphoribosyltransferase
VREFEVTPEQAGVARGELAQLKGGTPADNAAAIMAMLGGKASAFRDIVLLNAGAALVVAGKAAELAAGVRLAGAAIDSGGATATLSKLIAITREPAPAG